MKIVLYSGYDAQNDLLDEKLVTLTGKKKPSVTYIPASDHAHNDELDFFCDTFSHFGMTDIKVFHVDKPFTARDAEIALRQDIVYMSGGNTFYLMHHLKKSGFGEKLRARAVKNGVTAGLSAGAIVLTPSIATAGFPEFDRDSNDVGLKINTGLNILGFEIFPHYQHRAPYPLALKNYSKKNKRPIFALPDGAGIVVDGPKVSFYGPIRIFMGGQTILKLF